MGCQQQCAAQGPVSRQRSAEDERNLIVSVTECGEALKEQAISIPNELAKCVSLDPDETLVLYRLLYKLLDTTKE